MLVWGLLFLTALPFSAQAAPKCGEFQQLKFKPTVIDSTDERGHPVSNYPIHRAKLGNFQIDAGETPKVILDLKSGNACVADLGIVLGEKDVWSLGKDKLLYSNYQHGIMRISLVEAKTCKKLWEKEVHEIPAVSKKNITIAPDCGICERYHVYHKCECAAGEVWEMNSACELALNEKASEKLTREVLKISFSGKRAVENAKSPQAKLIE